MPKADKQIIIDFIIKGIEEGKPRGTLLSTTVKKWQMSDRTFDRHWKIANAQHVIRQEALKKELAEVDKQAAIEARKRAIMSAEERKEYLTKLINGKIKVPYTEVKWDAVQKKFVTIKFVELATHSSRISAIAELNKMEGDYAPQKINADITGGFVQIIQLPDNGRANKETYANDTAAAGLSNQGA